MQKYAHYICTHIMLICISFEIIFKLRKKIKMFSCINISQKRKHNSIIILIFKINIAKNKYHLLLIN